MTALPYDPERSFGFLLHDAARLLRRDFDRRTRAMGLSRAQWAALAHLRRREGCNQSTLAELLEVEPITLARLLDRMEAAGWVERRSDPGDRRARLVYLAAKAKPLLDQLAAYATETREHALAGLAPQDQERLMDMLHLVRANLARRDSDRSLHQRPRTNGTAPGRTVPGRPGATETASKDNVQPIRGAAVHG